MNLRLSVLLLLAGFCAEAQAPQPQDISAIRAPGPGYRLPENLVLHYKAEWRLLNAGIATLQVERAGDLERVTAEADSSGLVAKLYHVHDVFESDFKRDTFCSAQIHKHTEEGSRRREDLIRFDYTKKVSVRDISDLKKKQHWQVQNPIPNCATDVVSALVYAGSLPLAPGAIYSFPLNDGGKTADINLQVEAREQVKTGAGDVNAIRVQPKSDSDILKKRGKIWVWYSDDERRLPVQMRGSMKWGTLTMTLDRIENLPSQK